MSFGLSRGRPQSHEGFGFESDDLPALEEAGGFDPRAWFQHPERELQIEIGSGKGTFLVQQSVLQPEINFLGIEWAAEFFRYAADRMRRRDLNNVRMLRADATEFLRFWCPAATATVLHVYFSDPWPKSRHHKRRVIQRRTLETFHRVLAAGGEVRLVTDHADLWAWYEEHATLSADLFDRQAYVPPPSAGDGEFVGTNFERKFVAEGTRLPRDDARAARCCSRRIGGQLMYRPGADRSNIEMTDILCDFCHRTWGNEIPMVEGHQGSCVCGNCLMMAYSAVVLDKSLETTSGYKCPMCLEADEDRAELKRADEAGWQSPAWPDAVICRRCIKQGCRCTAQEP